MALHRWGLGQTKAQGVADKGVCNPDCRAGPRGPRIDTRWRVATGEVGRGPLKNWGGCEAALKEGKGRGLTQPFEGLMLLLALRKLQRATKKRGALWSELDMTERKGRGEGERGGDGVRN